jgi:hypothetical protein
VHSVQLILAIIIVREDNRSADQDEDKDKAGNKKDTQRQTIDTQHQKLKTHETHGPRTHGFKHLLFCSTALISQTYRMNTLSTSSTYCPRSFSPIIIRRKTTEAQIKTKTKTNPGTRKTHNDKQ